MTILNYQTVLLLSFMYLVGCTKDNTSSNLNRIGTLSTTNDISISTDISIQSVSASSTTATFPVSNAIDTSTSTFWSSSAHTTASNTESINFHFSGFNNVNYVRLLPRYVGSSATCFPVDFKIYYSTGSTWVLLSSFTNFPTPLGLGVTIPISSTVNTDGIQIVATTLSSDGSNFYFQLANVAAGYDSGFNHFQLLTNNGAFQRNTIKNVGSGSFDPNRISNWNQDDRDPIIAAIPGGNSNIYAPNIVYNNGAWNIYFGGWDGTTDGHDRVSITVSGDTFSTFGTHTLMIDHGVFDHVNNETVIKKSDGTWHMYYTSLAYGGLNKPGYATSPDGVAWTPSSGLTSYLINMSGYNNFTNADVNGANVIYYDGALYHLFFDDFNSVSNGYTFNIHHATSTDGINFTYTGDALNEKLIAQDVKQFNYNGTSYYLMGLQLNSNFVRYSIGTSLTNFSGSKLLFNNADTGDQYITSMGFVTNANKLLGVIYGAGSVSTLDHNSLHARWLTKKVIFISDRTQARWGDVERAHGPDEIYLYMNTNIETGHFYIYDSDGTTLLYTSPQVTMKSGDVWSYLP
ncbi:MAG: discoidin domain-containing protein [Bacteroidota bacterium]|uniref:discoidin domain-containing protein n=1 Tax=Hydrotalea lipotrueae TaxID=2803817 RepID=UPI001C43FD96|nr:discoidin domain-containing protein [Hydrotalea lipotrueae]